MKAKFYLGVWVLPLLCAVSAFGAIPPRLDVGGDRLASWTGFAEAEKARLLTSGSQATFQYPQGNKGWAHRGFKLENDSACDWHEYYALQLDVSVADTHGAELEIELRTPPAELRQEFLPVMHATAHVNSGDHRIELPWSAFGVDEAHLAAMQYIQSVTLKATKGDVIVRGIRLTLAPVVAIRSTAHGYAVMAGNDAKYNATVYNCSDTPQRVMLSSDAQTWAVMTTSVLPAEAMIAPGESIDCQIIVHVPAIGIPPGGHETQHIIATAIDGTTSRAQLDLVTAVDIARPSIIHTPAQWQAIRDNVAKYDWAKQAQNDYVATADNWVVPDAAVPPNNYSVAEKHAFVFKTSDIDTSFKVAVAWQLTRDSKYAKKVATFLKRLADEQTGYPSTYALCNQGGPQEGGSFQTIATIYDTILDSGELSAADCESINRTLRMYMQLQDISLAVGNVGNWSTAADTAALFCALSVGDLSAADRFLYGTSGFTDYLSKGVMDDGWWWECSTSYNFWVASELTQAALACRPWGIDLLNVEVPTSYSNLTIATPWGMKPPYGISFEKWGPIKRSTRSIRQMWDAVPPIADYRGIAFGMNDGHQERVGGERMELAYYAFGDPKYAALIRASNKRDLLYAIPELPAAVPQAFLSSTAENLGYALLRSQTADRPPREQISAVAKIGTQGGFHGHFDRVALDDISRYGRSFWSPESIWYGYGNFMYKFFVQTTLNHNIVVVDQKQQEAVSSSQPLFYAGKAMQAVVQETKARWSDPPYGGMQYFPGDTFAEQMRKNKQSIPLTTDRPYGELGPYTDPVLQRRLTVVTDDYVVLADYLKSEQPHTFDFLLQMKEFMGLDAPDKKLLRHDRQFNSDPHSAAQFVTDCDWYSAVSPSIAKFRCRFGPDADNEGTRTFLDEPGMLNLNVHSLWPPQQELMLGMPPETHDTQQWVKYEIAADGKVALKGESGIWILGAVPIDVDVQNVRELRLSVSSSEAKKKTLFWANPRFLTADGKETVVVSAGNSSNVAPAAPGKDYYGGPIKIEGELIDPAIATQPKDIKSAAVIHIPVAPGATRFRTTLGGDYPIGDESQRRRVFASRTRGTSARFLTVIEPFESKATIISAQADSADHLTVQLSDGRTQELTLQHFDGDGKDISVRLVETKAGQQVRSEQCGGDQR